MEFAVGDYVLLTGKEGYIRYIGERDHRPGQWYGIELVIGDGTMSGIEHGRTYFACKHGKGIFVRASAIKFKFDHDAKQKEKGYTYPHLRFELDKSNALKPSVRDRHKHKNASKSKASSQSGIGKTRVPRSDHQGAGKPVLHTSKSVVSKRTKPLPKPKLASRNKPSLEKSSQSVRLANSDKHSRKKPSIPQQLKMDKIVASSSQSSASKPKPKPKPKPQSKSKTKSKSKNAPHRPMPRPKLKKMDSNIKPSAYLRQKQRHQQSNSSSNNQLQKHTQLSVDECKHSISKSADHDQDQMVDMNGIHRMLQRQHNHPLPPRPRISRHLSHKRAVAVPPPRPRAPSNTIRRKPPAPPLLLSASSGPSSLPPRHLARVPPPRIPPPSMSSSPSSSFSPRDRIRIHVEPTRRDELVTRHRGMSTPVSPVPHITSNRDGHDHDHKQQRRYQLRTHANAHAHVQAYELDDICAPSQTVGTDVKDGHWRCVYCTRDNLLEFKYCPICGVKQPDEKPVMPASDLQLEALVVDEEQEWKEILSELQQHDDEKLNAIYAPASPTSLHAQSQSTSDLWHGHENVDSTKNSALTSNSKKKSAAFSFKNWILSPRLGSKSPSPFSRSGSGSSQSHHNIIAPTTSVASPSGVLRNIWNRTPKKTNQTNHDAPWTSQQRAARSQSEYSHVQQQPLAHDDGDREESVQSVSEITHRYSIGGMKLAAAQTMIRPIRHEQSLVLVPDTPMLSTPTEDVKEFEIEFDIDNNVSDTRTPSDDTLEPLPSLSDTGTTATPTVDDTAVTVTTRKNKQKHKQKKLQKANITNKGSPIGSTIKQKQNAKRKSAEKIKNKK